MSKIINCIICPLSCEIHFEKINNKYLFSGNICSKGKDYAIREIKNPVRIVTTTVIVNNGDNKLLPVRSDIGINKDLLLRCIFILSKLKVDAPIKRGDIIYRNILNTGVNIIASKDLKKKIK